MNEEPEEDEVSGRLRAEDRRGRVLDHFHGDDRRKEEELPAPDPEETWVEAENQTRGRWVMFALSTIIVIAMGAVIANSFLRTQEAPSLVEAREKPALKFHEEASPEQIEQEAEKVISSFMNAKDDRERCRFILGGESRLFQLQEFYQRMGNTPPKSYGGKTKIEPYALEGEALFAGVASDPNPGKLWLYHLRSTESGLLIDWEASVGYGDISWDEFLEQKPTTPVEMRVYLTGILAPLELGIVDEDYRTFEFSFRGKERKTLVSIKRGTEIEKELLRIVPRSVSHPVNLLLRWIKDDLGESEIQILQVLHNYWVTPASGL